jgi:hypothetical protein
MAEESKPKWLDKLRQRRQARRARTVDRQRQRSEHQRELERSGKAGRGSVDLGAGGM